MFLPSDPNMLVSLLNMKLRDEGEDLDGLSESLDFDKEEILAKCKAAHFTYNEKTNQFTGG